MTVERLESEMSSEEFDQWIEFYALEPFGNEEKMNDMRHASLCSLSVSIAGSDSSPTDFMMYKDKDYEEEKNSGWEAKLIKAMTTV